MTAERARTREVRRSAVVADDHEVVRRGLVEILVEDLGFETVDEASDYSEARRLIDEAPRDLVLLDIQMPGGNAIDFLSRAGHRHPDVPVLVLSSHPEDQFAVRMIRAGAAGYVSKGEAATELVRAIRTVLSGATYVSPSVGGQLAEALGAGAVRPRHEQLSDREFQVLVALGRGETVSEIAERLHLSVKTVSTYRRRVAEKLDCDSTAQMIRYAIQNSLV